MGEVVNKIRQFNAMKLATQMKWDSMVMQAIEENPEYTNTTGRYDDLCNSEEHGALHQLGKGAEGKPQNGEVDL